MDAVLYCMYVKEEPFVNRSYTKGIPFRSKGQGVGPRIGASLYKTLLSAPLYSVLKI